MSTFHEQELRDAVDTIKQLRSALEASNSRNAELIKMVGERDEEIKALNQEAERLQERWEDDQLTIGSLNKIINKKNEYLKSVEEALTIEEIRGDDLKEELDYATGRNE